MKLEKQMIGAFMYFAEGGETIDGITVGAGMYPDVDPIENWTSLGKITEVDFETETEEDSDYVPSPAGGYDKEVDEIVVADLIKFKSNQMHELFWRLKLGVDAKIADTVAQTPMNKRERKVDLWLKVQGRAKDGVDRVVMNIWGSLSIDSAPKWSKDPTKPAFKFRKLYSSIATVEPNNIVA